MENKSNRGVSSYLLFKDFSYRGPYLFCHGCVWKINTSIILVFLRTIYNSRSLCVVYRSVRVGVELSRKRIAPALIAYFLENDSTEIFYNDAISIP